MSDVTSDRNREPDLTSGWRAALAVTAGGGACLLAPALLNGAPLFYFDTAGYIHNIEMAVQRLLPFEAAPAAEAAEPAAAPADPAAAPADPAAGADASNGLRSGRSVYYGALAWLGWQLSIWLPALVQCLALAWLVMLHTRTLVGRHWQTVTITILALLAFGSSAGLFAALVMPDIWIGLAVLALARLWMPGIRRSAAEKTGLFAILAFSVLSHSSHLAVLAVMVAGAAGLWALSALRGVRFPIGGGQLVLPLLALGVGLAGQIAFGVAVRMISDAPPLGRPHITAHLVDLGPGTRYAQESCPESGYALCAYADRLPVDWIAFLFSRDPETGVAAIAPVDVQRALADEQIRFALGTLAAEPVATLGGLTYDGVRQLWTLSIEDVAQTRRSQTFLESNFPADLVALTQASRLYDTPEMLVVVTRITQISTALAGVLLAALLLTGRARGMAGGPAERGRRLDPQLRALLWIVLAGLVINALVCGILASPYGRFQARIAWLLPFLALLSLAAMRLGVSAAPAPAPPASPPSSFEDTSS